MVLFCAAARSVASVVLLAADLLGGCGPVQGRESKGHNMERLSGSSRNATV